MANIKIGKIVAVSGLKGEVVLEHELGKKTNLKDLKVLLIEVKKDETIPYFISSAKGKSDTETIIKLEDIDTPEKAKLLTRKPVWLSETDFEKQVAKTSCIAWLGYTLFNDKEELGEIVGVFEQPQQILCTVDVNGKEALVPVHDDNLLHIDQKNKKLYVQVPDGLLELYLE